MREETKHRIAMFCSMVIDLALILIILFFFIPQCYDILYSNRLFTCPRCVLLIIILGALPSYGLAFIYSLIRMIIEEVVEKCQRKKK